MEVAEEEPVPPLADRTPELLEERRISSGSALGEGATDGDGEGDAEDGGGVVGGAVVDGAAVGEVVEVAVGEVVEVAVGEEVADAGTVALGPVVGIDVLEGSGRPLGSGVGVATAGVCVPTAVAGPGAEGRVATARTPPMAMPITNVATTSPMNRASPVTRQAPQAGSPMA